MPAPLPPTPPRDLTRTTLGVLFIGLLIVASLWILRPFIAPTIWAMMIVVSTWPLMRRLQGWLWGRRSLAVLVMSLAILMLLVVPLMLAIGTIVRHADDIVAQAAILSGYVLSPPPPWVEQLPLIGDNLARLWEQAAEAGSSGLVTRIVPYADDIAKWFVAQAGSLGLVFVQFLIMVALAAVMYAGGESAALALRRFGRRLAGAPGEDVVTLAGLAIRGVALGVGVTAVLQASAGGLGLAIAGVPFAGLLTAVMLLLCIAQLGPSLVLFPAVAWVYWNGDTGWGTFLLVWTLVVTTMDNIVRPALIKIGADLPLLLIFGGVIGGLLAFGLIGIFVGPVILAVAYTLLGAWIGAGDAVAPPHSDTP
ncbi:MAG TPA: AI-2E family transporter YdiK [Rubrivivax sp.]|nr:AI-2E family transporter YdiK [Rubrivivax sp.]